MTLLRFGILCLSLLASDVVVAAQGYLTGWDPVAIRETLIQGSSTNIPLTFAYTNTSNFSVRYIVYVQDDSSCPNSASSHSWIPLNPMPGSMPATIAGSAIASVPLNTSGLGYGSFSTNVCFVADDPNIPTNIAVPVTLKSVATDGIFLDGFL